MVRPTKCIDSRGSFPPLAAAGAGLAGNSSEVAAWDSQPEGDIPEAGARSPAEVGGSSRYQSGLVIEEGTEYRNLPLRWRVVRHFDTAMPRPTKLKLRTLKLFASRGGLGGFKVSSLLRVPAYCGPDFFRSMSWHFLAELGAVGGTQDTKS
jgi:hypothetical protein